MRFVSRQLIHGSVATMSFLVAAPAAAQPPDLGQLSIEELMQVRVQQVFGTADRLQPVTEVPSSVSIVTANQIALYGYRTLADILRSTRGFYVTNDLNYSYVGARGFLRPGDYSTRVLLLVNGQRVNDNVYDQANVGLDFGIDAAMFERVEIIRGPASSLYGANALFAIVNVVTRTGASMNGASLDADVGTLGMQLVRGSAGRLFANGADLAISVTFERSGGVQQLFLPTFDPDGSTGGLAEGLDGEKAGNIYARFSKKGFSLTGTFGRRLKVVPTASFSTLFNAQDPVEETSDGKVMLAAQYVRTIGTAHLTTTSSIDHASYAGVYPFAGETPDARLIPFFDGFTGLRWTIGSRLTQPLAGRQVLSLGAEFVNNLKQDQFGAYEFESEDNFDIDRSSRQGAVYVQDEITLKPWLRVNAGLRYDHYSGFGRMTPRGAVIVTPSSRHSIKYLYGRAFRPPNVYELYYFRDSSAELEPESIITHEGVWEAYFSERVRTAVSAYRYRASQLLDLRVIDADATGFGNQLGFGNEGATRASGLELETEIQLKRGAQVLASYTLQEATDAGPGGHHLTNSPRYMAKLRLGVPGPLATSFAALEWQYLSARATLTGMTVDPASIANVTATVPIGRDLMIIGQIRNLFGAHYADPGSDEHVGDSIPQSGRTARIGVRWMLWRH
jgi:outer membrane receptor for ferrienterochelin and colicins